MALGRALVLCFAGHSQAKDRQTRCFARRYMHSHLRGIVQMANTPLPAGDSPQRTRQAWSVLIVSTLSFTVCFMVWMMFGVIGIPIKKMLDLNATQFGLLMSMPVLTGSLSRVPLGIWTDRFGGRVVMAAVMATTVPAIWLMSYATQYWHFLAIGLFVGLAGVVLGGYAYVARWFPKTARARPWACTARAIRGCSEQVRGPVLLVAFGWTMVPQVYAAIMLGTLVLFWMFSYSDPAHLVPAVSSSPTSSSPSRTPRCSSTASTTALCSVAMWPCRCGWCSTTWVNTAWTSALQRCWRPASRCLVACCAPLAVFCPTNMAPTA